MCIRDRVAKERVTQLNSGVEPSLPRDNDKNTVISLREIAEEKVKVTELVDSAVYKLRKHVEQIDDVSDEDEEIGDDFENLYKGEISKSGIPILPSKRARKIPEKIQVSKEDLAELGANPSSSDIKDTEEENTGEKKEPESLEADEVVRDPSEEIHEEFESEELPEEATTKE